MNYNNTILTDYATKKTRFLNFVLDSVLFFLLHVIHVLIIGERLHSFLGQTFLNNFLYFLLEYFLYHFIFELAFSRTPGKFLTGTKVIDDNERRPAFKTILIRTLCRLIPFDGLSFLVADRGWHDSISKTEVIHV